MTGEPASGGSTFKARLGAATRKKVTRVMEILIHRGTKKKVGKGKNPSASVVLWEQGAKNRKATGGSGFVG